MCLQIKPLCIFFNWEEGDVHYKSGHPSSILYTGDDLVSSDSENSEDDNVFLESSRQNQKHLRDLQEASQCMGAATSQCVREA